jgi:hypothetical protein
LHLYQVLPGETCILASSCLLANAPHEARAVVQDDIELECCRPAVSSSCSPGLSYLATRYLIDSLRRVSAMRKFVSL